MSMLPSIKKGDYVAWKWLAGYAHGTVQTVVANRIEIESKGKRIARNGTSDDPALIISDHKGVSVLKLSHEVQLTDKESS